MNRARASVRALLTILLLWSAGFERSACAADLALAGGTVYPSPAAQPIAEGTVVVRDGRILAVGPGSTVKVPRGAKVLDCKGMAVMAGFWNSHVHLLTQGLMQAERLPAEKISSQLEQMLARWGFTTVFDIASVLENTNVIRRRIASGEVRGPRILTVGDPFYPQGGTPVYVKAFLAANHVPPAEVATIPQAVARVRRQVHAGADGIKIFAASFSPDGILPMPKAIAKAIVVAAHRAGRPVFAHPSNLEGLEIAARTGVDVLAHTAPLAGRWSPELIARLKASHTALIPTLTLFDVEGKKFGESAAETQQAIDRGVGQLRAYAKAGGQILFGTDVGYTEAFDTSEELTLMARAGLSFRQILASLTTNPAGRFEPSRHDGRIAPGLPADLAVVRGDPASDVSALSRVRWTIRAGEVIYSEP